MKKLVFNKLLPLLCLVLVSACVHNQSAWPRTSSENRVAACSKGDKLRYDSPEFISCMNAFASAEDGVHAPSRPDPAANAAMMQMGLGLMFPQQQQSASPQNCRYQHTNTATYQTCW